MTTLSPIVLAICGGLTLAIPAYADWPTSGGDGGTVVEVTSLADSGPGSLRAALELGGRRTVIFRVAGEIMLQRPLVIRRSYVTVDGGTAPSPGISILGEKVQIRADHVILRQLRIRVGERPGSAPAARDGISVDLGPDNRPTANILIDHCSIAWAIDEGIGIWGKGIENVRIRRSIVAETLRRSVHPKQAHSMGMLIGKGAQKIVVEGNLFISNEYRNPVVDAGVSAVVVNNVIHNPGTNAIHIYGKDNAGPTDVAVVANLVTAGPDTHHFLRSFQHGVNEGSKIYFRDNATIGAIAFAATEGAGPKGKDSVPFVDTPPIWFDWLHPLPPQDLPQLVVDDVGARPGDRDTVDRRLIAEFKARTGAIRDMPGDPRLIVGRPLPAEKAGAE